MKHFLITVFAVFLFSCQSDLKKYEDALCIANITVIDPISGSMPNQTLIIKEGKIAVISPSSELKLDPANNTIDGSGKFLIPGLWDAHVHFVYLEELGPAMFDLFLAYGITSVRDTGGKTGKVKQYKLEADANPTRYPRVKFAGPLLDGMPNVYDGSPGRPELSVGLSDENAVMAKLKELIAADVDLLKAYEMLTPEQLNMITAVAREYNLPVTGHIPLSMDAIAASEAGMGCMEHLRNLEVSCAKNSDEIVAQRRQMLQHGKSDLGGVLRSRLHNAHRQMAVSNYDEKRADEVLATFVKNTTWQVPTITLNTASVRRPFMSEGWSDDFHYMPQKVAEDWREGISAFGERDISDWERQYSDWMMMMIGKMHKAGVGIMAGTDCPIFFLTPGRSLHEELELLASAGLSPLEVLQTATTNPAEYFGMEHELGRIDTGMWADLVVLDADPLLDVANTRQINAIIKQGKYHARQELLSKMVKAE